MRVAFLTRDYPPVRSGISTHASSLANGLKALGVEVEVLVGSTDFRTLVLPLGKHLNEFDIVHVQSAPYGALVSGAPMVATVHSPIVRERKDYKRTQKLVSVPAYFLERACLRRASAIVAVSEAARDDLEEMYGIPSTRVEVIGNGVDFERYAASGNGKREPRHILVVSRLENRKNIGEALRAVSALPRDSYELEIVGEGSQGEKLRELARTLGVNATFEGSVAPEALPEIYRKAGIFLTTSRSEGFGLSLLEAMAAGCAVVASDIPTHRSLVSDERSGLLFGSPSEIPVEVKLLLEDQVLARRLGAAASASAKARSWSSVAERTLSVYRSVLSAPKGTRPQAV